MKSTTPWGEHMNGSFMCEDRSQIDEQKADDMMTEMAHEFARAVTEDLTYNSYRWQRRQYGIAAERLAKIFPRGDKYEERYQEELRRAA